jgi:phosphodiesterase/alkaline phosphatase D-like protein
MRKVLTIGLILLFPISGFTQKFTELLGRPTNNSITINVLFDRQVDVYFEYGTTKGTYPNVSSTTTSILGEPVEVVLTGLQQGTRYYYRTRYKHFASQLRPIVIPMIRKDHMVFGPLHFKIS